MKSLEFGELNAKTGWERLSAWFALGISSYCSLLIILSSSALHCTRAPLELQGKKVAQSRAFKAEGRGSSIKGDGLQGVADLEEDAQELPG